MNRFYLFLVISLVGFYPLCAKGESVLFVYDAKERRDPFSPVTFKAIELEQDLTGKLKQLRSLEVQGIIWDLEKPLAMIQDEIIEVGQDYMGAKVLEIQKNQVTLEFKGEKVILFVIESEDSLNVPSLPDDTTPMKRGLKK